MKMQVNFRKWYRSLAIIYKVRNCSTIF